MDALKQVLNVLRLEPRLFHRLEMVAPWGMGLETRSRASFHLVEAGECWLHLSTLEAPLRLGTGDLIVVSDVADYALSTPDKSAITPLAGLLTMREGQRINPERSRAETVTTVICGEFRAEHGAIYPLFSLLPPLIVVPGERGQAVEWLRTALYFIADEAAHQRPGSETVISRLMDVLFIMVMRFWIDHHPVEEGGWLGALYDPVIGQVLAAMHRAPEHPWTVAKLARTANLSRSVLAAQFTRLIGEPPLYYLTRWRMQLAAMWLIMEPQLTIETIAGRVGYTSAYAFSKAFKRWMGVSPSAYRKRYA